MSEAAKLIKEGIAHANQIALRPDVRATGPVRHPGDVGAVFGRARGDVALNNTQHGALEGEADGGDEAEGKGRGKGLGFEERRRQNAAVTGRLRDVFKNTNAADKIKERVRPSRRLDPEVPRAASMTISVECPNCGAKNRKPRCGSCQAEIADPIPVKIAWWLYGKRKDVGGWITVGALLVAIAAWYLRGPSDLTECREQAARTARSNDAMRILLGICNSRFQN